MKVKKTQKLIEYIESEGILKTRFAEKINVSKSGLSHILLGKQRVSLEQAYAIEKATYGHVKITDWIENYEPIKRRP